MTLLSSDREFHRFLAGVHFSTAWNEKPKTPAAESQARMYEAETDNLASAMRTGDENRLRDLLWWAS